MMVDDENDPVLAAVAALRTCDVSQRHARRLRRRCHLVLQTPASTDPSHVAANGGIFRRIVGPALAGVWCVAYLVEILRRAAAYFGGP
jgi:hypothetical protein